MAGTGLAITAMPHQRLPSGQNQGLQQLCDLGIQVVFEWYSSVFGSLCSVFWFFAIANTVCLLTFWPTRNPSKYSYYNYKRGKRVLKWGPRASCQAEGGLSRVRAATPREGNAARQGPLEFYLQRLLEFYHRLRVWVGGGWGLL